MVALNTPPVYKNPLFFMTHVENISGILRSGILPLNVVKARSGRYHSIARPEVQGLRDRVQVAHNGLVRNLHAYAPLYFAVRTPMLYSRREVQDSIAYLEIAPAVLDFPGVIVADGNAAMQGLRRGSGDVTVHVATVDDDECRRSYRPSGSGPTGRQLSNLYAGPRALERLPWDAIRAEYWGGDDEAKRQKHAEALVPGGVPPTMFQRVHARTSSVAAQIESTLAQAGRSIPVNVSPDFYFASSNDDTPGSSSAWPLPDLDPAAERAAWEVAMARANEFDADSDFDLSF